MLDSTAVVAAERQGKNARQLLESVELETGDDGIAFSVVTVLELAHGITCADTPERRERRRRFLDELLTGVPIQPVTVPVAQRRTDRWPESSQGCPHPAIGSADRGQRSGIRLRSPDREPSPLSINPRPQCEPSLTAPFPLIMRLLWMRRIDGVTR